VLFVLIISVYQPNSIVPWKETHQNSVIAVAQMNGHDSPDLLSSPTNFLGNPIYSQGINGNYPWTPLGPNNIYNFINSSGKISAFAVDWSNPNIMFLGSGYGPSISGPGGSGGIYKTVNGGNSWQPVDYGLNSTIIDSLVMNQSDPNMLLASTLTGGIYKTVDGGTHWYKTAPFLMSFDFSVGGNEVYLPTYDGVVVSSNFGSTWHVSLKTSVPVFAVSTTFNGTAAYAVDWEGNVYFTSNSGITWKVVSDFSSFANVGLAWSINVVPWNESEVYLAYSDLNDGNMPTLWKSTDGGKNWANYTDFTPNSGLVARSVAFNYQNHSTLYLTGQGFAYVSQNGGSSFTTMSLGTDNRLVWSDPLNGSKVFIGSDQGLFVTGNLGANWISLSRSLNVSMLMGVAVANGGSELQVPIQDYSSLYSLTYGRNWQTNYPSEGNWPGEGGGVAINPENSSLVYFFTSGVLKLSNTSGQSWITVGPFTPTDPGIYYPQGFATDSKNPNTVYLATKTGLFVSRNWGYNWTIMNGSPKNETAVALDPVNNSKVFVATSSGLFLGNLKSGSWTREGAPPIHLDSIAVDPENDSIIFVGAGYFSSGSILRSMDGGQTFNNVAESLNLSIGFTGGEGYTLYYQFPVTDMIFTNYAGTMALVASTSNGLYISTDNGVIWNSLQFNIVSSIVTGIASSGGNLFVSTWGEGVLEYRGFNTSAAPGQIVGDLPTNSTMLINGLTASINGSFEIFLPPGKYDLTLKLPGREVTVNFTISSFEKYELIVPSQKYVVVFTESGLPSGITWYVNLTSFNRTSMNSGQITGSSYSFDLTNGTYSYTIQTANKIYEPSVSSGSFTVNGVPITDTVTFLKSSSISSTEIYVIVGVVAAIAVVTGAVLVIRKKK